jgi:phosphoglycolate phosphatase
MRYALILWDFDGTLADTLPGLLQVFNDLAPEFGLRPIVDVQAVRDASPIQLIREQGVSLWKLPALRNAIVRRQQSQMADIRLVPGMGVVLERLSCCGYRLGIVSSNSEDNIRTCLRANGAEQWFELIAGYSHLLGKQRPLRQILRRTKLKGRDVLYVGDEVRDIAAARRASMDAAAVTWGINTHTLLAQHSPNQLIDHPDELLQWLEP